LGKTATLGLIDQEKFKLTFINQPIKLLNLENEPPKNGPHGKIPAPGYPDFSLLGTSGIYFTPFLLLVLASLMF
jgi:hypothetical protein